MDQVFVSAGTVDITPRSSMMLGGYENRKTTSSSVADALEANILRIEGKRGHVIIVTTDLLYPGQTLRNRLLSDLDLLEEELFLCASHTHYAPMTAPAMPLLGAVNEDYVRDLSDRISMLVRSLQRSRRPYRCTYHEGALNHSISRRLVRPRLTRSGLSRSIVMGPNARGERDETVRILRFSNEDGVSVALLWNYACHASDYFDRSQVSAAYPGKVRERLREQFGKVPILFLQGFSGDVRPPFFGLLSLGFRSVAARILLGPQFKKTPTKQEWEIWSSSLADAIAKISNNFSGPLETLSPMVKRIEVPESEFAVGGRGTNSLFWHVIDCGGFQIVGINAEPAVGYRRLIEGKFDSMPFLTVGCLDQTHCYLPTDAMIAEGGYEVDGFRRLFAFDGRFRETVQTSIIERLSEALHS